MILAFVALAAAASAQVELTPRLVEWHAELEKAGTRVLFARVYTDTQHNVLTLAHDAPARHLFAAVLAQPNFVAQFVHAHALTITVRGTSLVFLNMQRAAEWQSHEEALLAHELAHIDLNLQGYGNVQAQPSCLATHATNIVQHVLVRRELRSRGIDEVPFRVRALEATREALASATPAAESVCDNVRSVEMWVDTALGLADDQWPKRAEFLAMLEQKWPELASAAARVIDRLREADLSDKAVYNAALADTLRQLK